MKGIVEESLDQRTKMSEGRSPTRLGRKFHRRQIGALSGRNVDVRDVMALSPQVNWYDRSVQSSATYQARRSAKMRRLFDVEVCCASERFPEKIRGRKIIDK